ncbi:unnamed protein product [Leptosia nina]|uniref:Secreted protein n=1 Tax=Leptosia nina TaxID=320188 RepID=A0AAV1J6K9_9NEOP
MNLEVFIIAILLNGVFASWLPKTKKDSVKRKPTFPKNLGSNELSQLKIPNKDFCQFMEKEAGTFLVLPWWHYYCESLREQQERGVQSKNYFLPIYSSIVERIQWYRRRGIFDTSNTQTTKRRDHRV